MIMEKSFIEWYKNANEKEQMSVYNFVTYIYSGMKFRDRLYIAFEIVMGKKFCILVSKNQYKGE